MKRGVLERSKVPRQIIDTETSRPRYVRRIVLTVVVAVLIVAVLLVLAFAGWGHFAHAVPGK